MKYLVESFSIDEGGRENEDFLAWEIRDRGCVAVVADGVGGNDGGALASRTAVTEAMRVLTSGHPDMQAAFQEAAQAIARQASENPELRSMATTMTAIRLEGSIGEIGHVGDSRLYHLRGDGLIQLTADQSEAALLVAQGVLTARRAKTYHRRSVLYSALSSKMDHQFTGGQCELMSNDRVILLSDGLSKLFAKKEIRDISLESPSLADFSKRLQNEIRARGPRDDTSCVLIELSN